MRPTQLISSHVPHGFDSSLQKGLGRSVYTLDSGPEPSRFIGQMLADPNLGKNPLLRHDSAACGHLCDDNSIPFLLAMSSAYNSQCLAPRDRLEKQVCLNRIHALIFFVVCFLFRLRLLYSCETFTLVSRHTTVTSSPKKNVNQQSHSYR